MRKRLALHPTFYLKFPYCPDGRSRGCGRRARRRKGFSSFCIFFSLFSSSFKGTVVCLEPILPSFSLDVCVSKKRVPPTSFDSKEHYMTYVNQRPEQSIIMEEAAEGQDDEGQSSSRTIDGLGSHVYPLLQLMNL